MKKKFTKKTPNFEISQDLNTLLKKYNIDKAKYIKPYTKMLYYNPENVVEGTKNIENLTCPICYDILKNPISCNSTKKSHSFCEECINKSLEINDKCPLCKQEFQYEINKKLEKLLQKLKFKCIYAEEGCPKILDYFIYFKHIDKCGFREILYECNVEKYSESESKHKKCGYVGTIKKINRHFLKCAFQECICFYCNKKIIQALFFKHIESECNMLYLFKDTQIFIGKHEDKFQEPEGFGKCFGERKITVGEFKYNIPNGFCISKSKSLTYEGEYKDGFLDGYGIIYDEFGEIYYKGECKNGDPNGVGTLYYKKGFRYEGQMKNGEKHGYSIIYHDFENDWIYRYEGEFKNDVSNGYGIMYFKDGSIYNGEFKKNPENEGFGSPEGFGLSDDKDHYYKGQFKNGYKWGYGINYFKEERCIYKGEFVKGVHEGYGIFYYPDGDIYEGEFKNDNYHGFGFLYKPNGEKFINIWEDDELIFEQKL